MPAPRATASTFITSQEWLAHPGSVGRALSGDACTSATRTATRCRRGQEGQVFFEPTARASLRISQRSGQDRRDRATSTAGPRLGDVGWLDEEGYLYLTDRKSFMIISGGVNIYPQEIENLLITHPKVADVAVVGAPHEEMGEQVVAVVQPLDMAEAGPALADELTAYARAAAVSRVKMPRQIDFREELPRQATGKLYKRLMRDDYWAAAKAEPT